MAGLTLPALEVGQVYRREEVAGFVGVQDGTSDYDLIKFSFPFDPVRKTSPSWAGSRTA